MKATLEIPDELYALVKARAALEGRTLRSVAIELLKGWVARTQASSGMTTDEPRQAYGGAKPTKRERRTVSATNQAGPGEVEVTADALEAHRAHLRKIMQHPRAIDEIAGVLTGPGPDMDMAAMRKAYEQHLADEWKRRRG